jgi:hypothetical protein
VILILVGGMGVVAALLPMPDVLRGGVVYSATVVASALLVPVIEIGRTLVYLDLRVRNEAYDLQRLAAQVQAG